MAHTYTCIIRTAVLSLDILIVVISVNFKYVRTSCKRLS